MITANLIDGFKLLGDAPKTVLQLRKLIVALAAAGKLTPKTQGKADSIFMLEMIDELKLALVQSGKRRTQNVDIEFSADALPAGLSSPYGFVRLGSVARIEKGLTGIKRAKPGPYPLVVTAEDRASCDHFDFDGTGAIVPLVSSAGHGKASLQRLHFQKGKFALGSILAAVFPHAPELISARFLFEYLTAFKEELLVSQMIGTANVSLSISRISDVPVPLVPPSVQCKVDELMALCDRLEMARTKREATRDRLTAASLARLNTPDSETFEDDVRFALGILPAITIRAEQIAQLRHTILNLAVSGKLASQDPNDEPASELLKRIATERARLVADRRIRVPKIPFFVNDTDIPAGLPQNWEMLPLSDVALVSDPNPSHRYPPYDGGTVPILSTQEFEGLDGWNPSTAKLVRAEFYESQNDLCRFSKGDIVFARKGRLGLPRFLPPLKRFTFSHTIFVIKPVAGILPSFLLWTLRRIEAVKWLTKEMNQNTGVPTLGKDKTERLPIALPPFAEQVRIVAKIEELMALCDRLEASLAVGYDTRARLLDALLREALRPSDYLAAAQPEKVASHG